MTLQELLKHHNIAWPEGATHAVQDEDGWIKFATNPNIKLLPNGCWDRGSCPQSKGYSVPDLPLASDWDTAIVSHPHSEAHPHAELMLQYAQDAMTSTEPHLTIEEIIAEIRHSQKYLRKSKERAEVVKRSIKAYEDMLLSLGVQLVPPEVGEPLTIGELKSGHPEPLTLTELKSETWYLHSCTGEDFAAFIHNEVPVYVISPWDEGPDGHTGCVFSEDEVVRVNNSYGNRKEIRRMGNKFYWESDLK